MSTSAPDPRSALSLDDEEYKRLDEAHRQYDCQLKELHDQAYLNAEDLLLEIQLKKLRLRAKDQMELLAARRRRGTAHA